MDSWNFSDGNISDLLERRSINSLQDMSYRLRMHSSLVRRLALDKVMEGHRGCVNAINWNSSGSLLISGSDDTRVNIWSYSTGGLIHSIDSGHSANIFCTKFVPETCDELLVSGAGDAEVRLFNLSRARGKSGSVSALKPSAFFQCHSRRVKKLAVEVGNPNIVWSASEDGTLRQHDIRECSTCPPAGSSNQECRNVLLDLRCGAKKSLADPPNLCLLLKSCDISTTRPYQILVGGSDAFARLYDRRMLSPLNSCQTKAKPPPCISYFCPMHLSEHRRSSLHLTHVAFSPNGDELLLSYSGEHAYLMDVNHGDQDIMRYLVDDVSKLLSINSYRETSLLPHNTSLGQFSESKRQSGRLEMYKTLVQAAAKTLDEGSNVFHGIEMCNEVLHGKGPDVGPAMRHECLCIRAALLLKRKWKNDVHMAIRDCKNARSIDPLSFRAYYCMSEALMQLRKYKEALDYALAARKLDPTNSEAAEKVVSIMDHIAAAEAEKIKEDSEDSTRGEVRRGRLRSLSDVLFRTEFISEDSLEGHEYERVDSDYEDEMEVDFETSIAGNESHDDALNILPGSLNLRFHQRDNLNRENRAANDSHGPSAQLEASYEPEVAIDMKQRYVGHCNVGTDIKQASFLGQQVEKGFMAQTGDRTGTGKGGDSVYKFLYGEQARFFDDEIHPDLKHSKIGTVAMASAGEGCNASQFYITLRDDIDYLDGKHTVFGIVEENESFDSLAKINEAYVDTNGRPFKDIRIKHTYILDDPFDDPSQLAEFVPEKSPEGKPPEEVAEERLEDSWVPMDEKLSAGELEEVIRSKEAHTNAAILESIGDIPDAEMKPPDNVLFVCKLNPVTQDEDLYTIFSRFGTVTSADTIRDFKTGDSLCYAFIEFEDKDACERAYFKMDNALIDDRRIRVDFSQSVAKLWKQFRHGKRSTKDGCFKCGAADHIARYCTEEPDDKQEAPKYVLKDANTQHGGHDHKSYDMLFDEENIENTEQKHAKKMKTSNHKFEDPRYHDHDNKGSGRHNRQETDRSRRHGEDEKEKPSGRDDERYIDRRAEKNGDREHYRKPESSKQKSDEGNYRRSGSSRDGNDGHNRDSYRKDEGEYEKRRPEVDRQDRHRRDDRSYEKSRDRDDNSYRDRRHRDRDGRR